MILMVLLAVSSFASGNGEKELEEINISYVRDPFNLPLIIMKEKQMAEEEFGKKGIKVNYYEINSGAKQSEAIAAGSLDIASVINTASVILANAAGNPVEIFSGFSRPEQMFTIITASDSVKTPADLRGKTVAGPRGTVLDELLEAVLAKEGMSRKDINFVNMSIPNATSAMLAGKVDCALAAAAGVIAAEKNGARILVTCEGYVKPLLVAAAGKKFAAEHPAMLETYLSAYEKAVKWIAENEEEAIRIGAEVQDISLEDAKRLYSWSHFISKLTAADLEALDYDIDFMLKSEMIDNRIDKMSFVNPSALE